MVLKRYRYRKGLVATGILLTIVSFLFVFPYVGFNVNRQYAHVAGGSISVTGLAPQDPLNLFIFAVLSLGGVGLLVKGLV
jgi:hypothetical protein